MPTIAVIGTCDTKLNELLYLREQLLDLPQCEVILIDVGRTETMNSAISIKQSDVCKFIRENIKVSELPRGELIKHMIKCLTPCVKQLFSQGRIDGVIAAGGSGGTSLVAPVMRESLPIGFPKLIVSTVASGDTGPLVGECDITMMYSVVDIAGSNELLKQIFQNAAGAIYGMAVARSKRSQVPRPPQAQKRIGMTMFGVTTPCVDAARKWLEGNGYEVFVFHATGHGGMAMERLVTDGQLDAVLDITTTEICDHIAGGVMSAGPRRLDAAALAGMPYVLSLGATDMVNFGPKATVPEKYQNRKLYEHNPTVTLMRTSKEECKAIGDFIVQKLKTQAKDPANVQVILPTGGVSLIATPGAPFADEDADAMTFNTIEEGLKGSNIQVIRDSRAINDAGFATEMAKRLHDLIQSRG